MKNPRELDVRLHNNKQHSFVIICGFVAILRCEDTAASSLAAREGHPCSFAALQKEIVASF